MAAGADLSAAAARARANGDAEAVKAEEPTAPVEVATAFLVYIGEDGRITLTHDLNVPITVRRQPTHDEIYGTMQVIIKDIVSQQTGALAAQGVLQMQQQAVQQMMGQQGADQLLQQLAAEQQGKKG